MDRSGVDLAASLLLGDLHSVVSEDVERSTSSISGAAWAARGLRAKYTQPPDRRQQDEMYVGTPPEAGGGFESEAGRRVRMAGHDTFSERKGLPEELETPRRSSGRPAVSAGSACGARVVRIVRDLRLGQKAPCATRCRTQECYHRAHLSAIFCSSSAGRSRRAAPATQAKTPPRSRRNHHPRGEKAAKSSPRSPTATGPRKNSGAVLSGSSARLARP